jgi:hypothetical protein
MYACVAYQDDALDGVVVKQDSTSVVVVLRLVHVQEHVDEVPVIVTTTFTPFTVAGTAPLAVVRVSVSMMCSQERDKLW